MNQAAHLALLRRSRRLAGLPAGVLASLEQSPTRPAADRRADEQWNGSHSPGSAWWNGVPRSQRNLRRDAARPEPCHGTLCRSAAAALPCGELGTRIALASGLPRRLAVLSHFGLSSGAAVAQIPEGRPGPVPASGTTEFKLRLCDS